MWYWKNNQLCQQICQGCSLTPLYPHIHRGQSGGVWNQKALTHPCCHLRLCWRAAVSRPVTGPERSGADRCSQSWAAGPEEPNAGSHPPPAERWPPGLTDPPAPLGCETGARTGHRNAHMKLVQMISKCCFPTPFISSEEVKWPTVTWVNMHPSRGKLTSYTLHTLGKTHFNDLLQACCSQLGFTRILTYKYIHVCYVK